MSTIAPERTFVSLVKDLPVLDSNILYDYHYSWKHRYVDGNWNYNRPLNVFIEWVRIRIGDPDSADEITMCANCDDVIMEEDGTNVANGDTVCNSCARNYYRECHECSWLYPYDNMTRSIHDRRICRGCRDDKYTYCNECAEYYPDSESDEHEHPEFCCESPEMDFTIRNDGDPPLRNDTVVTITLPAGVIDDNGITRIQEHLRDNDIWLNELVESLDRNWQTKRGNFTRRLSAAAFREYGFKIPPAVVSEIGCIARDHSTTVDDMQIAVTRDLNLPAEDFCHSSSCWWQSYSYSRCALKTHGGFGLRSFSDDGRVMGRAWVMPLKKGRVPSYWAEGDDIPLTPTFDIETPDAFIVFNGYGNLSNYTPARIISHMVGMSYRKVGFEVSGMYVNNDNGYLLASQDILDATKDVNLGTLDAHSSLHDHEMRLANVTQ